MEFDQICIESHIPSETKIWKDDSFQKYYEKETKKWKAKMVEVLGDLHLYNFCVSYGHPDYRLIQDFVGKETKKTQPFKNLHEMGKVDKEAEEQFCEILSSMENKMDTSLHELLHERKKECTKVFEEFDNIVTLSKKYFELEYADCRKRALEQVNLQKPMINEIEKYLSEVEEAGDREIIVLKDNIASYIREIGLSWSNKIEEIYEEINSQPPLMELLSKCTEAITSKDIRCGFLMLQKETGQLWKKAFDDLLMLSAELEKYRYNYNMTKSKLERAIYWMNRNYRDNMPELTKTQRKITFFADRKARLFKALLTLEQEMKTEKTKQRNIEFNFKNKVASMEASNKRAIEQAYSKHRQVFEVKKSEVFDILKAIVKGDQYIHEEILNVSWKSVDLSSLDSCDLTKEKFLKSNGIFEGSQLGAIKTLQEDKFADAFRLFVANKDFVKLLSQIAEQLGFMLDFRWVDYVQKTLEIEKEVRWLELFKVFKIDFTEDLKDLKEHMMKFSKDNAGEIVFDINGAIDGFLQFAALKKKAFKLADHESFRVQSGTDVHEELWISVDEKLPKTLLWDNVLELLRKFRELLHSQSRLLTLRSNMVIENEELEKYLENYYSYDVPTHYYPLSARHNYCNKSSFK